MLPHGPLRIFGPIQQPSIIPKVQKGNFPQARFGNIGVTVTMQQPNEGPTSLVLT
jgi:hypothetical protein